MNHVSAVRRALWLVILPAALVASGCIHNFWRTVAVRVALPDTGTVAIKTPLKVHLTDGRTVVFRAGASIDRRAITGTGDAYPMLGSAADATKTSRVPLDSIVGVETFESRKLGAQTFVVSAAATAVTAAAAALTTAALLVAIFGSCPTVYADTGASAVLQAEGFSYAIAPLLEQRDLDPLRVRPDSHGVIRLELRNEALETHYINNLELISVRHCARRARDTRSGRPTGCRLGNSTVCRGARPRRTRCGERARRRRTATCSCRRQKTVDAARVGDLDDWIDIDAGDLRPGRFGGRRAPASKFAAQHRAAL